MFSPSSSSLSCFNYCCRFLRNSSVSLEKSSVRYFLCIIFVLFLISSDMQAISICLDLLSSSFFTKFMIFVYLHFFYFDILVLQDIFYINKYRRYRKYVNFVFFEVGRINFAYLSLLRYAVNMLRT